MLPKIQTPMFDVVIPSSQKKVKIRPMLVKEEKILLMAKQSTDRKDILDAVTQIVNNCIIGTETNVEKLALFDIEYLFIKIRSVSISNKAKVSYRDNEDEKVYDFEVDLDKVEIIKPESQNVINIGSNISVILKYPQVSVYTEKGFFDLPEDKMFDKILTFSIDKVFEGDKVYPIQNSNVKEIQDFIDSIPAKEYGSIRDFFVNTPSLNYEIKYTNSKGTERIIKLTTLDDFFTFV